MAVRARFAWLGGVPSLRQVLRIRWCGRGADCAGAAMAEEAARARGGARGGGARGWWRAGGRLLPQPFVRATVEIEFFQ